MRATGFEPAQALSYTALNRVRLTAPTRPPMVIVGLSLRTFEKFLNADERIRTFAGTKPTGVLRIFDSP